MTRTKNAHPDFQTFWDAYGLKRDRIAAERAWQKLPARDRRAALTGIAGYRADCERNGISMMYAQGYLNHRRWEDESTPAEQPASSVQRFTREEHHPAPAPPTEMLSW